MLKLKLQALWFVLADLFNIRDDDARGRVIYMSSVMFSAFYNVFITGIFYTGFLSMYDISITGVGIISFIPYIANVFTIFSSRVLGRFKRRKPVLLATKVLYFALKIVAVTLMPQFVQDPHARLIWFGLLTFIAHAFYAPFAPGQTVWFYHFYPAENQRRTHYIQCIQIFSSIMSTVILLFSGMLTDAVAGSPMQDQLIIFFRYAAFALTLIETVFQFFAKEYPEQDNARLKLTEVFTLPLQYPKFLRCMVLMFVWNFVSNLNSGLWNYHLLNHMHFSYMMINSMSIAATFVLLLTSGWWQRLLRRYSWIKTFGIACLMFVPTEFIFFVMSPESSWIFIPNSMIQNLCNVGLGLAYGNILYLNLPQENSTAHIAFHTIGCNIFAFLGLLVGTWVSSLTGDSTFSFLGMQVYSVQFTTLMRGVALLTIGLVLTKQWRLFTREEDIAEIEENETSRRRLTPNL